VRYGEANGIIASSQVIGANPSITDDAMWIARNATDRSAALRWIWVTTKRWPLGPAIPCRWAMPRATTMVNRMIETSPVPRSRYHSAWVLVTANVSTGSEWRRSGWSHGERCRSRRP
jgi:hypothetical protein